MPPYCQVCNKDLATDSGSDGNLCLVHSREQRRKALLVELNQEARSTAEVAEVKVTPGSSNELWITIDLSGSRVFAQSVYADVRDKSIPYEGTYPAAPLSDQALNVIRDAVVVALRAGYRFVPSSLDQIEANPAANFIYGRDELVFGFGSTSTNLLKVSDWSKYADLDLAYDNEFYVERLLRQWKRDVAAQRAWVREAEKIQRNLEAVRRYNDEQLHRGNRVVWSTAGPLLFLFVVVIVALLVWLGSL